jgi:hypothetical protein
LYQFFMTTDYPTAGPPPSIRGCEGTGGLQSLSEVFTVRAVG